MNISNPAMQKAIMIIAYILGAVLLSSILKILIRSYGKRNKNFNQTVWPIFDAFVNVSVALILLIAILDLLGVNTTGVVAFMGTLGIGVGLALKDTLSNIAAGIVLIVLRPFNVGDFIEFGGVSGTVEKINLFSTTLKAADGIFMSTPNKNISSANIKNFSRNPIRRIDITVGISYDDSIDKAIEVLTKIKSDESRILAEPGSHIVVSGLGDSSVNILFRAWTNSKDYLATNWELQKTIKEQIEAANLSIPYPQMDVHLPKNS